MLSDRGSISFNDRYCEQVQFRHKKIAKKRAHRLIKKKKKTKDALKLVFLVFFFKTWFLVIK